MNSNKQNSVSDNIKAFEGRARELVSQMNLEEKISQMMHDSPAIDRLGVSGYNWWNECLHGVARAGTATVFPQAIGMAASWDTQLMRKVADAISDEARAKYYEAYRQGDHGRYKGLTYWSPNINIFRDPRWGRGHETYGEDPYLTSKMGVEFVKGLQGEDPVYLKLVATPKHFAVHSGPEGLRHEFDVCPSRKDLYETYLPAFKACVQEADAVSVMSAYNRVYGEVCSASKTLLQDILRDEWGFNGYVVSDCGAIQDIHQHHKVTNCTAESAAISVKNGCDLECGCVYASLITAVEKGLVSEKEIDTALIRLFTARFRLGMFDAPEEQPYFQIPFEVIDCDEHRTLARQMARESIVLLKNVGILPLKKELNSIAVIGPNADCLEVLLGNYNGFPSEWVTPLQGIRNAVSKETKVYYSIGCHILNIPNQEPDRYFSEAVSIAQRADVVVMCLGLSPLIEGEEGDAFNSDAAGDKLHLDLTGAQQELLERISALGKPVVLVLLNGSAVAVNWPQENVNAVIEAWYPGEEGGNAIADIIFGDYNPSGRLPVTFYKSLYDVPPFTDYSMKDRTYKYFKGEPLYPFGFGLSYTNFEYSELKLSGNNIKSGDSLSVSIMVRNAGKFAGEEVVQVYLTDLEASVDVPIRELAGFQRIQLAAGETKQVDFIISPELMSLVNNDGKSILEPGAFRVTVGGSQGDSRSIELGASQVVSGEFTVL